MEIKDKKLYCGTENGTIGIFDCSEKYTKSEVVSRLRIDHNTVNCMHIFGSKLFIGHYNSSSVWDLETRTCLGLLQQTYDAAEQNFVVRALHANETHLFVGLENGKIESWDLEKKKCLFRFQAHAGEINQLQIRGSQLFSSSGSDSCIKIWDIATGKCLRILDVEGGGSCFQLLGSKVCYDWFNELRILDLETKESWALLAQPYDDSVTVRKIVTLGTQIFAITDEHIHIYDFAYSGVSVEQLGMITLSLSEPILPIDLNAWF